MPTEPPSTFSDHTQSVQNSHQGTEFIRNINQSISDSYNSSQMFQNYSAHKMKFLYSQSHKLTKIVQCASKVQQNITDFIHDTMKTEKILIDFYEFSCEVFKEIGLVKQTFDVNLSRISTVFKTIKKNYETTKKSPKATANITAQPTKSTKNPQNHYNFPSIPKVLQITQQQKISQPFIKGFTLQQKPDYQFYVSQQQEIDFKQIQLEILKRIQQCQHHFQNQNFAMPQLQNIRARCDNITQEIAKMNSAHSQEKSLKKVEKNSAKSKQAEKANSKSNNGKHIYIQESSNSSQAHFHINFSESSNQQMLDELIKSVLAKKKIIKKYLC